MNWKKFVSLFETKTVAEQVNSALGVFSEAVKNLESINKVIESRKNSLDKIWEAFRKEKADLDTQGLRISKTINKINEIID